MGTSDLVSIVRLNETDGEEYAEQFQDHAHREECTGSCGGAQCEQLHLDGNNGDSLVGRVSIPVMCVHEHEPR